MIRSFITQRRPVTSTMSCSVDIRQVPFSTSPVFTNFAGSGSKQTPAEADPAAEAVSSRLQNFLLGIEGR